MTDKSAYGAREERSAQAAGIAGYCFLFGCGGIVLIALLAKLFGKFRIYAPMAREWLLGNANPSFAAGMVFGWLCIAAVALCIAWKRP